MPLSTRKGLLLAAGIPSAAVLARAARIVSANHSNRHHCPHSERAFWMGCFDGRLNLDHARRLMRLNSFKELTFTHDFSCRLAGGAAALLLEGYRDYVLGQIILANRVGLNRGYPLEEVNLFVHLGCGMLEIATALGGELSNYDATSETGLFRLLHDARQVVLDGWKKEFPAQPISVRCFVTNIGLSPFGLPKTFTTEYTEPIAA